MGKRNKQTAPLGFLPTPLITECKYSSIPNLQMQNIVSTIFTKRKRVSICGCGLTRVHPIMTLTVTKNILFSKMADTRIHYNFSPLTGYKKCPWSLSSGPKGDDANERHVLHVYPILPHPHPPLWSYLIRCIKDHRPRRLFVTPTPKDYLRVGQRNILQ